MVTQQAKELIITLELENKFNDKIYPLRDTIFEQIQRVEDRPAEILSLMGQDDVLLPKKLLRQNFQFLEKQN